jgi:hypothetical protein
VSSRLFVRSKGFWLAQSLLLTVAATMSAGAHPWRTCFNPPYQSPTFGYHPTQWRAWPLVPERQDSTPADTRTKALDLLPEIAPPPQELPDKHVPKKEASPEPDKKKTEASGRLNRLSLSEPSIGNCALTATNDSTSPTSLSQSPYFPSIVPVNRRP